MVHLLMRLHVKAETKTKSIKRRRKKLFTALLEGKDYQAKAPFDIMSRGSLFEKGTCKLRGLRNEEPAMQKGGPARGQEIPSRGETRAPKIRKRVEFSRDRNKTSRARTRGARGVRCKMSLQGQKNTAKCHKNRKRFIQSWASEPFLCPAPLWQHGEA